MTPRIFAAWWAACLLWSSTFLFIRIGVAAVPPLTFAWSRLAVALCILAPLAAAFGRASPLSVADVARVMGAGVLLLGVNYGLVYWGAQFVPSGLVAILQSGTPIVALGLGWASGSERVTRRKVVAAAAGMLGVALIFGAEARASGARAVLGAVAVTGGLVCVALAYVWFKGYGKRLPPLTVTALQCVAGICVLAPVAFIHEGSPAGIAWTTPAVGALLYLALAGSVVAFWLNYWLLARMDASALLMMGVAEVPIAVLLGAAILGERLPPGTLAGGILVLTAVAGTFARPRAGRRIGPSPGDDA